MISPRSITTELRGLFSEQVRSAYYGVSHKTPACGNRHRNFVLQPLQLIIKTSGAHAVAFHPPTDTNVPEYFINFIVTSTPLYVGYEIST